MLRTTTSLSRSVLKWVSQVTASLGATLAATLIWSAVPHPTAASAPQPELTSGGKFAARAILPLAYDGLDTMPLPHVAPAPARFVAAPADAAPAAFLRRASWEGATFFASEPPARAVRPARPAVRAELRRTEAARRGAPVAGVVDPLPAAREEGGFVHSVIPAALPRLLPAIVSTARDAWSVTASAGDMLVARVVPQIP